MSVILTSVPLVSPTVIKTPSRFYSITSQPPLSAPSLVLQPLPEVVPCAAEPSLCCDVNDDAVNASDLSVQINQREGLDWRRVLPDVFMVYVSLMPSSFDLLCVMISFQCVSEAHVVLTDWLICVAAVL